jgi:hypothetical protein
MASEVFIGIEDRLPQSLYRPRSSFPALQAAFLSTVQHDFTTFIPSLNFRDAFLP